jgi:hypothetical protein
VDRAARRVAAEEKKKKKDTEKTRARERMRARDALMMTRKTTWLPSSASALA